MDHDPGNPDPETLDDQAGHIPGGARTAICDWLRALGLDPSRFPANPRASMKDGQLTLLRKVGRPGRNGGLADVLTPDGTDVMTETITVPVTVPPPPIVEIWLANACPTCGR